MRYESAIRSYFKVSSVSGDEFLCHCPFHEDTSEGHLYANGRRGLYICFSCGAKGSLDNLSIGRVVVGSDDVREKIDRFRNRAKMYDVKTYPESWLSQFDVPHPYWVEERELPEGAVDLFRLGYDPFSNRCTIPLRDMHGRILGVTYRRLDDGKPKYLEPKTYKKGKHLYGAWLLEDERKVALVEGQVDAIRGWSFGVPTLSPMGARITKDQIKVLQHKHVRTVVLMFDNDSAGTKGILSALESFAGSGIRVLVGWYRDYWYGVKDPDALSRTRYRKMFHSAIPATAWAERVSSA